MNVWKGSLKNGGFKLNLCRKPWLAGAQNARGIILIGPEPAVTSQKFWYLGSVMHESGGIDHDVHSQIRAAWAKWQEITGGVCDLRILPKHKGLIYKSIIQPMLL